MAGKRVLYIDPVGEKPEVKAEMLRHLNQYKAQGWADIQFSHLSKAPLALEYYSYLSLIGPELLQVIKQAEKDGYDAAILGCFCDPHLEAAKEICERMVVVGVMEAAVHLATFLAPKFSIIAARKKSVPCFRLNLQRYGLVSRLASFRSLELEVEELLLQPQTTYQRLEREVRLAVEEDGAEAILLGCTCQLGHFQRLQQTFGIPVIDASLAGLLEAEHLCQARERCGWYTSKLRTWKTPPPGESVNEPTCEAFGLLRLL